MLFIKFREKDLEWLIENDGLVYFDVERNKIIHDALKEKLENNKRRKKIAEMKERRRVCRDYGKRD